MKDMRTYPTTMVRPVSTVRRRWRERFLRARRRSMAIPPSVLGPQIAQAEDPVRERLIEAQLLVADYRFVSGFGQRVEGQDRGHGPSPEVPGLAEDQLPDGLAVFVMVDLAERQQG